MAVSDPIADMLTKIRNASRAGHSRVDVRVSKFSLEIAKVLKSTGFVKTYKTPRARNTPGGTLRIYLKYDEQKQQVLHDIQRVSKPGRRVYAGYREMPRVLNGYGALFVSTSNGVMTGGNARKQKVGGELICTVW